ncbi:MAG: nucleoside-diphosphate kinase [Bacteroidia bacterium]|nr:MAG: nucleoside-diphosphate kinase [Bacteroidia bacterium]
MEKGTFTLGIIKPHAVAKGYIHEITKRIRMSGFAILGSKYVHLSLGEAEEFYAIHRGQEFFERLTKSMSSGALVALIIEKQDAVRSFRTLIGATNPAEAAEGTLRKQFGESTVLNALHGSDSDRNARREVNYFFTEINAAK